MRNGLVLVLALGCAVSCRRTNNDTVDTAIVDTAPTVVDGDRDGVAPPADCDDANQEVHPGAVEVCNGIDDDCDGTIDVGATDQTTYYPDADGDGHGAAGPAITACAKPDGYAATGDDCNDAAADVHPGASEADCTDPIDYNCDGSTGYTDADQDGVPACLDCDDASANIRPGAVEICDGVDDNCDGQVDEAGAVGEQVFALDADQDTFGDPTHTALACAAPSGYVPDATDCNDADAAIHPGVGETCDGIDQNCNGVVDDNPTTTPTWHPDGDGDGFGANGSAVSACTAPAGYVASSTDCDDADNTVHPGALEACTDRIDRNCDGSVGYVDADGDGFPACEDCDDSVKTTNPDGVEVCGGGDENCDGHIDEAGAAGELTWYADADGDGYGTGPAILACAQPPGAVATAGDCDDGNAGRHPGAAEVCDGVDQDCDGNIDEAAIDPTTFYVDADRDNHGNPSISVAACAAPSGFVASSDDCNDLDKTAYPGATEICDGVDNDCANGLPANEADADGDGVRVCAGDCDDNSATVHPGAPELCDGIDNDCVNGIPANESDADGDSQRVCAGDCNDASAAINSSATEIWYDGIDENCDGKSDYDQDGDGLIAMAFGGTDCNDTDANAGVCGSSPGAAADDCEQIHTVDPTQPSGLYWIDPTLDGAPFQAYCEMTLAGGGWTLISNRRQSSVNVETCGTTLAGFFANGCGAATAITANDSYAMVPVERTKLGANEMLMTQYLNGVFDNDDAYTVEFATTGTDLFPNTSALTHIPLIKACDLSGTCDTTNMFWKYIGDYWYHSSMCLSDSSFDATYRGNYGLCENGVAAAGSASTYPSSGAFGDRNGYDETKLWAHPNNAAAYQERIFYR